MFGEAGISGCWDFVSMLFGNDCYDDEDHDVNDDFVGTHDDEHRCS